MASVGHSSDEADEPELVAACETVESESETNCGSQTEKTTDGDQQWTAEAVCYGAGKLLAAGGLVLAAPLAFSVGNKEPPPPWAVGLALCTVVVVPVGCVVSLPFAVVGGALGLVRKAKRALF